ncbi:hypothetical protein [Nocardioides rubriscoriae]|uniref:hypothetical protein n=1 Tax=Nocardioides rubriscoriae TaxID=642762 RepID=UPI001478AF4F|nr:hypothetical protein [Nocardioides rubriscoriae]
MKIARKLALTVAATVLGASFVAVSAPAAQAYGDSSWGCGGNCRPGVPTAP